MRPMPVVMLEHEDHAPIALEALKQLRTDLDIIDIEDLKADRVLDGDRRTWTVRIASGRQLSVTWRTAPSIIDDYVRVVSYRSDGTNCEIRIHDGEPDGWKVEDWLETISLEAIDMIAGPRTRELPMIADAVVADHGARHGSGRLHLVLPSPWADGAVDEEAGRRPPSSDAAARTVDDMRLLPKGVGVVAKIDATGRRRIQCSLSPVEREYDGFDPIATLRLAAVLDEARRGA